MPVGSTRPPRTYDSKPSVRPVEERNRLAEQNMALVPFVRERHFPDARGADRDDLAGAGHFGLLRAAELWEPSRGAFSTYATRWILSFMWRERRRLRAGVIALPVDLPAGERRAAAGPTRTLSLDLHRERHGDDGPAVGPPRHETLADAVQAVLHRLPPNVRYAAHSRFVVGRSRAATADELDVSVARVGQMENRALGLLRDLLPGWGPGA